MFSYNKYKHLQNIDYEKVSKNYKNFLIERNRNYLINELIKSNSCMGIYNQMNLEHVSDILLIEINLANYVQKFMTESIYYKEKYIYIFNKYDKLVRKNSAIRIQIAFFNFIDNLKFIKIQKAIIIQRIVRRFLKFVRSVIKIQQAFRKPYLQKLYKKIFYNNEIKNIEHIESYKIYYTKILKYNFQNELYFNDYYYYLTNSYKITELIPYRFCLNNTIRNELIQWIKLIAKEFNYESNTILKTIQIYDRYVSKTIKLIIKNKKTYKMDIGNNDLVNKFYLQIIMIVSLIIGSKYTESLTYTLPSYYDFSKFCGSSSVNIINYLGNEKDTIKLYNEVEIEILKCLNYELFYPTVIDFIELYEKLLNITINKHILNDYNICLHQRPHIIASFTL
jgi:hypothetical protein